MDNMIMDKMSDMMTLSPIISLLGIAGTICCVLYMHYSAQHRNHKLSTAWYVCGVIFGFWTVLVFLLKKKDFPGPDFKTCPSCGNKCPVNYEVCNRCLYELPSVNTEEKAKEKKLSKIFGIGIIVSCVLSTVMSFAFMGSMMKDIMGIFDEFSDYGSRIAVDGVYYDKNGIAYEDENDVLLYDEQGRTYVYTVESEEDCEEIFYCEEEYYVRDDGEKYYAYDCYVTEDGWFYCDKAYALEYYYVDRESMSEEELDAFYKQQMEDDDKPYRYYDDYLVDAEGKIYYAAFEASWNEKGELITAENDPTLEIDTSLDVTE